MQPAGAAARPSHPDHAGPTQAPKPGSRWRAWGSSLLLTVFPPRCGACSAALGHAVVTQLCVPCATTLLANSGTRCATCDQALDCGGMPGEPCRVCVQRPRAFAGLRAPWQYGGALAELIVATKFRGREDLAPALATLIADDAQARAWAAEASCLVPIPLGRKRRRSRGYNPSAAVARSLGRLWDRPVLHALRRARDTLPQSSLQLAERRLNVREAFAPLIPVTGTALVIDDVVTSGETVHDAARALLAAGATRVLVVAAARAHA